MTERQKEICRRLANDETRKEIAHCLHISVNGVEYHLRAIRAILGVRTLPGIVGKFLATSLSTTS